MKKSKFTEAQIVFALRQVDNAVKVEEVGHNPGIIETIFNDLK